MYIVKKICFFGFKINGCVICFMLVIRRNGLIKLVCLERLVGILGMLLKLFGWVVCIW